MALNIEPLDRNQTTAFREREALRQKVNEIIEVVSPMEITWDTAPTQGHGVGYAVTSEGIKAALDDEETERMSGDSALDARIIAEQTARADADTALGTRIDGKQDLLTAGPGITISDNVISATGQGVEIDLSSDSYDGFKGILDNNTSGGALFSVVLSLAIQTVDFQIIINTSGSMRCGMDNPRTYTTILGGVIGLSNQGTTLVYPASGIHITQDGLSLSYIVNDELTERTIQKTDMLSFTTATAGLNVIYR